jgi:hypothetical protein
LIAFDTGPKFSLGEIHVTPGAAAKLLPQDIDAALRRHGRGDWGEVDAEGKQDNDARIERGGPIASIYMSSTGIQFYVVTEADRAATTVLLPEEY